MEELPFPAITICGQGLIKEVVISAAYKQFNDWYTDNGGSLTALANMTQDERDACYQVGALDVISLC